MLRSRTGKRLLATLAILALMAGTAWAVIILSKTSAPDTFTARTIGGVNIGTVETQGIFPSTVTLTNLEPGNTLTQCVKALLTNPQAGDAPRWYATGISGDLADDLTVTVSENNFGDPTTAGHTATCDSSESHWTERFSGTLAAFQTAMGSYATGGTWLLMGPNATELRIRVSLPAAVDPTTVLGQTATMQMVFENRGS
jgi:hypothetical protein